MIACFIFSIQSPRCKVARNPDAMGNVRTRVMRLGKIVNRSTLLKEVETDIAALLENGSDMDEIVLQFDDTDLDRRFTEARKHARMIVDVGGAQGNGEKPAPTPALEQPK